MNEESLFTKVLEQLIKVCQWGLLLLVIGIGLSGLHIIGSDEVGLVLRFGKLQGQNRAEQVHEPGLLFALPPIIDKVLIIPVGRVREITVDTFTGGFRTTDPIQSTGYGLTGDSGVVTVDATAKYVITDAVAFALHNADPESTIAGVLSSCINRQIVGRSIDSLLTTGKKDLTNAVLEDATTELDNLQVGVTLTGLEFRSIEPPKEVKAAFDAVNNASVQKETDIKLARQYEEEILPQAHAQAEREINDAQVESSDNLSQAQKDVAVFNGLLAQYRADGELVARRVWGEKIADILGAIGTKFTLPSKTTPKIFLP